MTNFIRRDDWAVRLISYLGTSAQVPFRPGQMDCALFAAGAVEAMTGQDLARDWRGRYTTTLGGLRKLRGAGYADHVDMVAQHFAQCPVAMARAGDIAVFDDADQISALGIVQGECLYVRRPEGLALIDILSAKRAFRV